MLASTYRDEVYLTQPPIPVQKELATVVADTLAPLGRLLGYRASYPEYSDPERADNEGGEAERSVPVAGPLAVGTTALASALLQQRSRCRGLSG